MMTGGHRMEIGAVLLAHDEAIFALGTAPVPERKGQIRLPSMSSLLNPLPGVLNELPLRSAGPMSVAPGPPPTLEAQQRQRRQSTQPESPPANASTASSPALSSASSTVIEPTTPPALHAFKGVTSPVLANQKPLPPVDTPFQYPTYRPGYDYNRQQQLPSGPLTKPGFAATERARQGSTTRGASYARARREHRPTYGVEEEHFIWYHRVDLNMDWQDIRKAYSTQFPTRVVRGHQGIQCKYYRCTEMNGIPKCRERNRSSHSAQTYGLRAKFPDLWYPWMREPASAKAVAAAAGSGKQTRVHA